VDKVCKKCNTTNTRKWYKFENGYICQKDYRKLHYELNQESAIDYQRNYYKDKKESILKKAKEKYSSTKDNKCHQRKIREKLLESDLKRIGRDILKQPISAYTLQITKFEPRHREFIKTYEWLGTVGNSPKWTFEALCDGHLAGVVIFNEPSSYSKNILNVDTKKMECLIQRGACASWAHPHLGSKLIMFGCRWLAKNTEKKIFVAYSDPEASEIGTIYQACNFDYLGSGYGAGFKYKHTTYKDGKFFSAQTLRRTSTLKGYLKTMGIKWNPEWQKESGFKDLKKLPLEIKNQWYEWGNTILKESKKVKVTPKGKYVLVLGKDRREQKLLDKEKRYEKKNYPKRT
jgi:hypothetical protein